MTAYPAPLARGRVLIPGSGAGPVLRLDRPISFWGGVDPATGRLSDPSEPHAGESIAGTILVLRATRGSSTASTILLELLYAGQAPAALIIGHVDAILTVGALVAREMAWPTIPILELPPSQQAPLKTGMNVRVTEDGEVLAAADTV